MPRTVLVTSRSFGSGDADPAAWLRAHGLDVIRGPADHATSVLAPVLGRATAWIAGTGPITAQHLESAARLRIIARYGVGVDAVDLDAAARRGIVVTNTPAANATAVAELTIALMLAGLRRVVDADRLVRSGGRGPLVGRELGGATVGLVGFGSVGREVARLLAGFGARVLVHDPFVKAVCISAARAEPASLERVIRECDVLSLHRTGGEVLVDAALLARVRPGLVLVNTARGDLVDEAALADGLRAGRVAAAGLDVLEPETFDESPLRDLPNVVVTPHIAAHTVEAVDRMGMAAAEEIVRVVVEGAAPRHPVRDPVRGGGVP